ncbi:MAG: DUF4012 domain-containing protein [Candidatus Komeilibacteria bacterium]
MLNKFAQKVVIVLIIILILLLLGVWRVLAVGQQVAGNIDALVASIDNKGDSAVMTMDLATWRTQLSTSAQAWQTLSPWRIVPVLGEIQSMVADSFQQIDNILANLQVLQREYEKVQDKLISEEDWSDWLNYVNGRSVIWQPAIINIQNGLIRLSNDMANIPIWVIPVDKREAWQQWQNNFAAVEKILAKTSDWAVLTPRLLGYPDSIKYLLLLQNHHEMRATGGFIGNYGILQLSQAKIVNFFIDDIYHLDSAAIGKWQQTPPEPISRYLGVEQWYLRDANWSPDWPTSARQAINFYYGEGGQERVDGVLAFNPLLISDILNLLGPVQIEGVWYAADNFTSTLQYEVEQNYQARGASHWDRKDVISQLADILLNRFSNLSAAQLIQLVGAVVNNVEEKNVLLYLTQPEYQSLWSKQPWSGAIVQTDGNYLMVVDSNMAAFKTNQYIDRSVDYQVSLPDNNTDKAQATVIITYKHNGTFSWDSTRYRTYTRVLVPEGAVLLNNSGAMANDRTNEVGKITVEHKYGKTIWGAFIAIEPGESGQLSFTYSLPMSVVDSLYWQSQPGMTDYLVLRVDDALWFDNQIKTDRTWGMSLTE